MGRKKTTGETGKMQWRASEADRRNIAIINERLRSSTGDADNTAAIRFALHKTARAGVPLAGEVGAGKGQVTRYTDDERIDLDAIYGLDAVGFRVRGNSMVDVGILPGDYAVVREQPAASNGETVVVRTAEGWMLKKINPETRTIYSGHGKELWQRKLTDTDRVLGVYLGVVRRA